jgi:two-component system chemotaxis response regulator CheB
LPKRDIVVVGASAGGVEALRELIALLPADLPAAVFVVLHTGRTRSLLPRILQRTSRMPVVHAVHGDRLITGRVYVAPPDKHLTLVDGGVALSHGPTVNGLRPAVDPLFQSAARAYGSRVLAVVLTGGGDDGTAGLIEVKRRGGLAVAQDPEEAVHPAMPQSAIEFVDVDHVLRLGDIAALINRQASAGEGEPADVARWTPIEEELVPDEERPGRVSALTCPECNGALWEMDEGGLLRFRCRIGHVYSPDSLLEKQADTVDRALWAGLRSLEERAALCRKLSMQANARGHGASGEQFRKRAIEMDGHADVLRDVISRRLPSLETPDYVADEGSVSEGPAEAEEGTPSTSR